MIDIKWIRNDPEKVKENIRKKFQDEKLPLVDEVVELDRKFREAKVQGDELRSQRKSVSKKIGALMGQGKKEEAEAVKAEVSAIGEKLEALEKQEAELSARIREIMLVIPNFIDDSVPIGKDDSENVEVERFGDPFVPEFEVPYHVDIMEKLHGIDIDAARDTSGNGFYYLCGDIARLHSSILAYARDFMINKGFTYYICGDGGHDVQDRGRGSVPHRHQRTLYDRQVHRYHSAGGGAPQDPHQLFPVLSEGSGRTRH